MALVDTATRNTEETPETTAPAGGGGTPEHVKNSLLRSQQENISPPETGDPAEKGVGQPNVSPPEGQNAAPPSAISGASFPTEGADPPHESPPEAAAVDPKDAQIAELEATTAQLSMVLKEATDANASLKAQHALDLGAIQKTLTDSLQAAASRYKEVVLQVHTDLPPSLIEGATIDQVEASIVKAKTIVQHVRDTLTAQAAAQVPGGAPVRGGPDIEGMTAIDKIKYSLATRKK